MSTAFDDVRLPEDIEAGALVGPRFSTSVVSLAGGKEQRNADWEQERLEANIAYGIMQKEDPQDIENSFARVMRFFRARMGRHRSFRFRDLSDYEVVQGVCVPLAQDRKTFQLVSAYDAYRRRITRPIPGTVAVYRGGVLLPSNAWALDPLGVIRFTDTQNADILADFEFDVPMRFDTDVAQVAIEWQNAGSISNINLVQSRE